MLNLGHFLEALSNYRPTGLEPAVSSVVVDSRKAQPGSVFVAFAGENEDGHDYVADAFERGAIAALIEHEPSSTDGLECKVIDTRQSTTELPAELPVCLLVDDTTEALQQVARQWRQRFNTRIVGITGSVGKTSTKELAHTVLSRCFNTLKSEGNLNNELGLPLTLLRLRPYHERAVLEMGMYAPGEIELLCDIAQPSVGVITNIGPAHMERLGSIDAIVGAKCELVESLPVDGVAILNLDDDRVMSMAPHAVAQVFTYGLDDEADLRASNIESMGLDGIRFTIHHNGDALNVHIPLLGRHSVHTALRATAIGLVEGMSWDDILSGLTETPLQLRLVVVDGPQGSLIIDDTYNSSPDSALAALNLLRDLDGRRVAILGDMLELGEVEEEAHRLVGARAAEVADSLITVGRLGAIIGNEAMAAGMPADHVTIVEEALDVIPILQDTLTEGDIALIKGSLGMRMDRIVNALGRND